MEKNAGFKLVADAFDKMAKVADLVNDHMRRVNNLKRLQQIRSSIEDGEDVEIVTPGREVVREVACKIVEKKSRVIDACACSHDMFVCAGIVCVYVCECVCCVEGCVWCVGGGVCLCASCAEVSCPPPPTHPPHLTPPTADLFIFNDMSLVCRVNGKQRTIEKELSYVSENMPPEIALKAFDGQDTLLELRYSQWGLSAGRQAVSLFLQMTTANEKVRL